MLKRNNRLFAFFFSNFSSFRKFKMLLTNDKIDGYEIEEYAIKDKNMFVYHTSVRFISRIILSSNGI